MEIPKGVWEEDEEVREMREVKLGEMNSHTLRSSLSCCGAFDVCFDEETSNPLYFRRSVSFARPPSFLSPFRGSLNFSAGMHEGGEGGLCNQG